MHSPDNDRRTHSRRDFLRGRAALTEASGAIGSALDRHLGPLDLSPIEGPRVGCVVMSRRAMACEFELRLNRDAPANATEAGMEALDLVERVEDRLTVYRERSELIELNQRAYTSPYAVDEEMYALLEMADRLHQQTSGAFDPTSGPLSRVWGFHQREGRMPSEEEIAAAVKQVGWNNVRMDPQQRTVSFAVEGLEINANSFGKGYALDLAGARLEELGISDSMMHGGRSTILARGDDASLDGGGWRVGLRDPAQPEQRLVEVTLRNEALSTSGQGTQYFEREGRRLGHVIDPRTGWPAEGLFSATVIAPTAAEADALSTALCVMGSEEAAEFCQRNQEIRALLLVPGEGGQTTCLQMNFD